MSKAHGPAAPSRWDCLAILLVGFGLLILAYMIIVKPDGTLTVQYVRQVPPQPQSPAFPVAEP